MDGLTLEVRPLHTAYDPPDGSVTVATPSCCCCCCCCLGTVAAATTFIVADACYHAHQHDRPKLPGIVLALAGVVLGFASLAVEADGPIRIILGLTLFTALSCLALFVSGASWTRSIVTSLILTSATVASLVVEVVGALVTAFVLELAAPGFAVLAWLLARSLYRSRTGWTPNVLPPPLPPYSRPPSAPFTPPPSSGRAPWDPPGPLPPP